MRLQGKVVLITGSTGMAAATADRAGSEGASVFTCALEPGQTGAFVADLRDPASAESVCRECISRYGRIDALFNVAGVSGRRWGDGPLHECTLEGWDLTLEANLRTAFLMTRPVLNQMLKQGAGGSILFMGSVTAFSPEPKHFATHAYAAAKGALEALTATLASYYAPHGIRVNAVAPGLVRTPMSARAQQDEAIVGFMSRKQPLAGGLITPEDVASAAVFLLSDDSRMVTGQVLAVDAGWSVR